MYTLWHLIKVFLNQPLIKTTFTYFFDTWFIWAPVLAAYLFWESWLNYIHSVFISKLSWVLLEIKIPRDITKSPKAMEVVLNALHNTRTGNLFERYWQGFLKLWYSLEIISIEGQIHFFIYVQKSFRNFTEAQFYGQYPGAEISEVEDYTQILTYHDLGKKKEKEWEVWGADFYLVREEAYPTKTYVDFGLESGKLKEEEKTDPLTSFLESLGSLGKGEQIWFQMIIRGADKDWKEKAESVIEELQKKKGGGETEDDFSRSLLSPGQREVLLAVEHNVAKLGFDTGIRVLYAAKKESFSPARKSIVGNALKQYSTQNMNSFKPKTTSVDYLFKNTREMRMKKKMLRAYQARSWFYIPYRKKSYVLNTESLATIFHFPGRVAETPTLGRIEAKRGEPPINLPI